ncbi:hypothetical protein Vadar_010946 [Vaccinium darrowii]|uniref:Uncharacterized protein n=1 Tax=Vaccinium darrowii TaxID=229202 RepID=A0ACB7Y7H6_9ERIC|nr:hypothetical protein Vadar_010946 [Vaccinium darrowii]
MNLTQLENLMLHRVNIFSGLPDSLLNLSSLATIDLSETGLLGDLPYEIFQLPKLQNLDLGYNYNMTGSLLKVKWGCNSSLEKLVLSGILMSGKLPDSIGYLRFLNYLDLRGNQFSGPLPESLGNLTRITSLDLSGNGFTGRSPGQGNNRNGEIPDFFARLLKLESLGLSTNNFGAGPFPLWVSNLTQLFSLDISNMALTGPIPSNITGFQKLRGLYLSNSSLNGTLPSWLFAIPSLQWLELSSNQLTGQIHEFQRDSPLVWIDLSYNKLSGPIPQSISGLVNLSYLQLRSNNLSGDVELQKFSNLPSLQLLDLSSNQLTGQIHEFRRDSPLESIDLSYNKLHGPIPQSISGLVNLISLYLQSNNLNGDVELQKFSNLSALDLSKNNLSVRIGSNANATWPNLSSLGLSSCNITEFPDFLQNLDENLLRVLDLSSNKIHGEIPKWEKFISGMATTSTTIPCCPIDVIDHMFHSL